MILSGRSALVTGGTGGLGRVVITKLVEVGAKVGATYSNEKHLEHLPPELRKSVLWIRADVSSESDVEHLFAQVTGKYGHVDILINTVGGFLPATPVVETSLTDWEFMMTLNLRTTFLCAREFLRVNKGRSYGRIVSIAAMPALRPSAGRAAYAISKNGVVVLTKILGDELKGSGVTANAIAPSIIKTQANMDSMPDEDSSHWVTPEEIAETIIFLCSDNGKSINGVTIPMFGGV